LYAIAVVGAVVAGISLLALVASLIFASEAAHWPMIVISSLGIFAGLQIICTGVVAVYLSSVLNESRARPTYVVGAKLGRGFDRDDKAVGYKVTEKALTLSNVT
nr:hypothetical protein [bacterium]